MTARQPRRRRRTVAAAPLPRPNAGDAAFDPESGEAVAAPLASSSSRRQAPRRPVMREHHVMTDYGYVHRDLLAIGVFGVACLAFIVGMTFVV
ncbi:MAG: hypothetical protein IT303_06840 [Dehalococcoidia bacterium]|nr:hypothetical protein [Dehalococcoidia bacterium]